MLNKTKTYQQYLKNKKIQWWWWLHANAVAIGENYNKFIKLITGTGYWPVKEGVSYVMR